MRIIFHIGQQKTGTTALQNTLVADRKRLRQAGICYPDAGHQRFPGGRLRPSHNGFLFALEGRTSTQIWQSPEQVGEAIRAEVEATQPDVLLLSAERAILAADQRIDLLERLDDLVPGPKEIVVYLRRPDRYLTSFHKQLIRMGVAGLAPLHTDERMTAIEKSCQLDHRRALELYIERYGEVRVFDYERCGDTVEHFYRAVLRLEAPTERPSETNPSIPGVLANLALEHQRTAGRLRAHQFRALTLYGEREPVDLLGAANRERCRAFYEDQNAFLGTLVGRRHLFDDLDAMTDVASATLTVAEADERYRPVFEALIASPDVHELRRDCRLLESQGHVEAAAALFDHHRPALSEQDRTFFADDLAASSKGVLALEGDRYDYDPPETTPHEAPRTGAGPVAQRVGAVIGRLGRRFDDTR